MTPIQHQLQQIHDLAERQFPESEVARLRFLSEKLTERLREMESLYQGLPVKEQTL